MRSFIRYLWIPSKRQVRNKKGFLALPVGNPINNAVGNGDNK